MPGIPSGPGRPTLFQDFVRSLDSFGIVKIVVGDNFGQAFHHVVVFATQRRLPQRDAARPALGGLHFPQFSLQRIRNDPGRQDGK
jgi:hypothetical protein